MEISSLWYNQEDKGIETKSEAKKETQAQRDTSRKKESLQKESYTSATFWQLR